MSFFRILFFVLITIFIIKDIDANSNKMLAVINDKFVIFDYDLNKKVKFLQVISPNNYKLSNELISTILNNMVNNYLIVEDAKKFGISVSYSEILEAISTIEKNNNLKGGDLLVKLNTLGLSKEEVFSLLKEELIVEKLKQTISFSRAKVSKAEIETEIRRVLGLNGKYELYLYEISISLANKSREEAENKIKVIYDALKKGESFDSVARKFSEAVNSRKGGEIGWIPEVFLPIDMKIQINNLGKEGYTPPFIIGKNYKIIFLKESRPLLQVDINNPQHMQQLDNFAKQKITYDKAQSYLEEYLKDTYNKATITYYSK